MPTFTEVLSQQTEQMSQITQELHEKTQKGDIDIDEMLKQTDQVGSLADDLARRVTEARTALESQAEEGEEQEQESSSSS